VAIGIVILRKFVTILTLAVAPALSFARGDLPQYPVAAYDPEVSRVSLLFESAREDVKQASARRRPSLDLKVGWRDEEVSRHTAWWPGRHSNGTSRFTRSRIAKLRLTYPIFDASAREKPLVAQAKYAAAEARLKMERSKSLLRWRLAGLALERDEALADLALSRQSRMFALSALARLRLDEGMAAVTELYEATSRQKKAEMLYIDASTRLADSRFHRYQIMNGFGRQSTMEKLSELNRELAIGISGMEDCALRHPSVTASLFELVAAEHDIAASRMDLLPVVTLEVSREKSTKWTLSAGRSWMASKHNGRQVSSVGITVKVPLFGRLASVSAVQKRVFLRDARRDAYELATRDSVGTAISVFRKYDSAKKALTSKHAAFISASALIDVSLSQFLRGVNGWRDVLDAEDRLSSTKDAYINARFESGQAFATLAEWLGDRDGVPAAPLRCRW
jgi:outer membrane protein